MAKTVAEYQALPYTIVVWWDGEDSWFARFVELDGCMCHDDTVEKAIANVREVQESWLSLALEAGQTIPEPMTPDEAYEFAAGWARARRKTKTLTEALASPMNQDAASASRRPDRAAAALDGETQETP
jgi:antitoxin HicB